MKKIIIMCFALLSISALYGCSATQNVRVADVNAKIPDGKAIVVLYRESSMVGGLRGANIYDNGKLIGDIKSGTKLVWERDANKIMCLNKEQTLEKYMGNPLLTAMIDSSEKPNCFKTVAGKVNQFQYDYLKGMFFTKEQWEKLQEENQKN
ncbi:hypothetical protein P8629_04650 [Hydrogenovibrio sp. 3SP14C1]|uniref:hypothetical protein n=1 Tax=Hydrogenovibrio sp. 3SP14C1 TaxID=3038774 RepID=UPI002415C7B9|nr:hypothetical protein [Hydrogenovibrio sp. 3SP14C1]MDG4812288.1 hypothetical protein [Hydrogenovibrio sp. 3SP14C1]